MMNKMLTLATRSMSVLAASTAFVLSSNANLILNGSFEQNNASDTQYNMTNALFNSTVSNVTAFGNAEEIDLIQGNPYGLAPTDGRWKLAIHRRFAPDGPVDAFALHLSSPVIAGQSYTLEFDAHAETSFDPGLGPVEIGLSSSATSFGTLIFSTGNLSTTSWTRFTHSFVSPVNASYITVRVGNTETWAHVDNFVLVPEPSTVVALTTGLAGMMALRRRMPERRRR